MPKASQLTAEERVALILESFRSEQSIADLCRKHGITQTTWRDKFLAGGKRALMETGQSSNTVDKARIEELERVIGKQTVEIQVLQKTSISADVRATTHLETCSRRVSSSYHLPDPADSPKHLVSQGRPARYDIRRSP